METNEPTTLSIRNYMILTEHHSMVKEVIEKEIIYDTLALHMAEKSFDETFVQSTKFAEFWKTLGESVTTLKLNYVKSLPIELETFFTNLRELQIYGYDTFKVVLPALYEKNLHLESILWYDTLFGIDSTKEEIRGKFTEILSQCKTLKLIFDIDLPLEASFVNEFFANINYDILQMDDITIDCEPLPYFTDYRNFRWRIQRFQMEFNRTADCEKLVIKPLIIKEELKVEHSECQEDCALDHKVFRCESATRFIFTTRKLKRCQAYYKSCFESFPFVLQIDNFPKEDNGKLSVMTSNYKVFSNNEPTESWPSFPSIKRIYNVFETALLEKLGTTVKDSFIPSTSEVRVNERVGDNDPSNIFSEKLENISKLNATIGNETLTPEKYLEQLGTVIENYEGLQTMIEGFKGYVGHLLDSLDSFDFADNSKFPFKMPAEMPPAYWQTETPSTTFMGLPNHIWEKIFWYLSKNQQLRCRLVCKDWFDIFSSGLKLDRTMKFTDCHLSAKTDPVNVFANTTFCYNRLLFGQNLNFAPDENLSEFWEAIGGPIVKLVIERGYTTFTDAFKTGLASHHLPNLNELYFDNFYYFFNVSLTKEDPEWQKILKKISKITFRNAFYKGFHEIVSDYAEIELSNIEEVKIINTSETDLKCLNSLTFPKLKKFTLIYDSHSSLEELFDTKVEFSELTFLSIAKYKKWRTFDFKLISNKCTNLRCLIIGQHVVPEGPNVATEPNASVSTDRNAKPTDIRTFDQALFAQVSKMMFEELLTLYDIYFVSFSSMERKVRECKVYSKSDVRGFVVSEGKRDHTLLRDFFSTCVF